MSVVCDSTHSVAMSASQTKLPASNITCRYWATSGTCFFGDQCNFAHNAADRAASGKSVPKSEKACKELLLTGFCKKENNGCEYNHDIPGVTPSRAVSTSAPTANVSSNLAVSTSWTATASRAITTTTLSPGTAAAIRSKRLPVSAPAFVPAAVAAAQRAALSAWGGVTPGGGKLLTTVNAQATFTTSSASVSSSPRQNGVLLSQSQATGGSDASSSTSLALGKQESEVTVLSSEPPPPPPAIVISSGLSSSTLIPSVLNAQPFVPNSASATAVNANGNVSLVGSTTAAPSTGTGNAAVLVPSPSVASAVSAAPFVPKAKQHLVAGGIGGGVVGLGVARPIVHGQQQQQPLMALTTPQQPQQQQQLQIRQHLSQLQQQMHQQAAAAQVQAQMLSATARSMGSSGMSSNPYLSMDVPMVMPPFRLPEGDDPALGMTAMSPPNPAFLARVASNGGLPVLPAPDAMASMGIVGDGTGGLQLGNTSSTSLSPPINYSSGIASPQSSLMGTQQQQLHHHVQRFQMQQQHHSVSGGPVPPFPVRLPQKVSGHTPEQQQLQLLSTQAVETGMGQAHEQAVPSSSASDSDQPSPPSSDTTSVQQSPQPRQQHSPQPQPQQSPSTQQAAIKQQQQQIQQQQQQLRQKLQQQQQHLQQLQQQRPQRSLSLQAHQRLPSSGYMRSLSPVSGIAPVAAATHGGATYFWGPGQGIGNVPHVLSSGSGFSVPGGRNEPRIARGQSSSSAGTVPLGSRFLPEHLREELRRRHALIHAQLDPEQDLVDLPEMVQGYHSLFPLEDVNREDDVPSTSFGVRTMIFKGISSSDGQAYAIRRIDSRQVIPTAELATLAVEAVERWAPLSRHPHIVALRESLVSREVEDSAALFFVHDYYPGAVTLEALHLQQEQAGGVVHLTVSEEQLWSYMVQLATVLRVVHGAGLFFRPGGLHPSKVLVPSRGRLRVSAVGILDVLHGDPSDDPRVLQREDLAGFGRLILALACGSVTNASMEFMAPHYSADLVRITQALLASSPDKTEGVGVSSIRQLYAVLAERMFGEIENLHLQNDEIMNELSKETENGRLVRILVKLGMMNERPDDDMDPGWSETGDRYLLKLFRDFVFHQTTEEGTPLLDWGHVIECLNKLDAGVPEKVILLSRDERSMLIASYGDLKRCLEGVYQELVARASGDKSRPSIAANLLAVSQAHAAARLSQRQLA